MCPYRAWSVGVEASGLHVHADLCYSSGMLQLLRAVPDCVPVAKSIMQLARCRQVSLPYGSPDPDAVRVLQRGPCRHDSAMFCIAEKEPGCVL